MRIILLFIGLLILFIQQFIHNISPEIQFFCFAIGILILGIPHGAADLLVATQNANYSEKKFSLIRFFLNYIGRLTLFAFTLWFFPLFGNILFIFLAAYHFGETDLHQFKTDTLIGKLLVMSYGLVILSVIIMPNFDEVRPILMLFEAGFTNITFISWLDFHRTEIVLSSLALLLSSSFLYFYYVDSNIDFRQTSFLLFQFCLILLVLYNLPMLLGFTYYFVIWHSIWSLNNITTYLKTDSKKYTSQLVFKQITFYSILAIGGIIIFGAAGFMFINHTAIMAYSFLGLAVLTAPHLQVMHDMYYKIRLHKPS